jgi:hypothetical protein
MIVLPQIDFFGILDRDSHGNYFLWGYLNDNAEFEIFMVVKIQVIWVVTL